VSRWEWERHSPPSLHPITAAPVAQFLALKRAQSRREVPKVRLGISTPICQVHLLVYQGVPLMYQGVRLGNSNRALAGRGAPSLAGVDLLPSRRTWKPKAHLWRAASEVHLGRGVHA
jgi:hypothetical protein